METITAISKMIASGDIPKEIYDKYLSKTKLGFCSAEKVEEIITKEATQLIVEQLKEQPTAHFTRDVFREDQRSK